MLTILLVILIILLVVAVVRQQNQLNFLYRTMQRQTEEIKALADRGDLL